MAAILYTIPNDQGTIFKGGLTVNNSVHIPFIEDLINDYSMLIVSEVSIQNRDTIQYFLTFNDLITYFYFGKGLGTMSINGSILGQCGQGSNNISNFPGVDDLMWTIGNNFRGQTQTILFGSYAFDVVLSAFTFRASAEEQCLSAVDFNLQLEIINHDIPSPTFETSC